MSSVRSLYRFPVKGLSGESLDSVALIAGKGIPSDRRYAITNGAWTFDAATFTPRPKTDFLVLLKHEALASLSTQYLDDSETLVVKDPQGAVTQYRLSDADGRASCAQRIADHLQDADLAGPPEIVSADGIRYTDVSVNSEALMNAVSFINLASVRDLSRAMGVEIDPLRFRANIYFDNGEPWSEMEWMEKEIQVGQATLRVVRQTKRCPAINVNPVTAERDLAIPAAMAKHLGHVLCGVYGEVRTGGEVRVDDRVTVQG